MLRGAVAIFRRDFKKFLSNPFVIVMTLFMPILYLVLMGNAMGGTITGIPIGVVQEEPALDYTPLFLAATDSLKVFHQENKPNSFLVSIFSSEETAQNALKDGRIMAYAVFPTAIPENREVRLYIDNSEYMIGTIIESGVNAALIKAGAKNPLHAEDIFGNIEYIQFFGIGVIVMAIFMTTMMGGGIALIRDREMGIIEGYLVTPVKRSSIILGTVGSGTVKAFLAGFVIFMVDIIVAGVIVQTFEGFLLVLLLLFLISLGMTSLVVALSSRFSNQQEYASSIAFLNLFLFMTSGAFYPVLGIPDWLRWLTVINPEAYAIHALRSIILRGQGFEIISLDLIALLVFTIGAMILGIATYRRKLE